MARSSVAAAIALAFFILASGTTSYLVIPEHENPLTVRMAQGNYTASINVTVVDGGGRKIFDAAVMIEGNSSEFRTGPDGTVLIPNLDADVGNYTLWASHSNYSDSDRTTVAVEQNTTTYSSLTLAGGVIAGIVTSSTSAPIGGAIVSIQGLEYATTASSSDGTYLLGGLPAGTHNVTAFASGYDPAVKIVLLSVAGFGWANFILSPQSGYISGHVYHADKLVPVNNTNISVRVGLVTLTVASEPDGSYITPPLPEGTYSVTASKDGFHSNTTSGIDVFRGNVTEDIDFYLVEKPTLLQGTVKSGQLLLVGVNITVFGTGLYNVTDSSGKYYIHNITAGAYTVVAVLEGYVPATYNGVTIPAGGVVTLDIDLEWLPGAILRGTVKDDHTQEQLDGVYVSITGLGFEERSTVTNIQGQFEFPTLPPGNYTLQFQKDGYKALEVRGLAVTEDVVTNRNFTLEPMREGFEGFIFGFDLAHSMMLLALFLTIVILAVAIYLRIRTFQTPETAPAVYDQAEESLEEREPGIDKERKDEGRFREPDKGRD